MSSRALVCVIATIVALFAVASGAGAAQTGGSTAVINGQEAPAGSYPYMAFVVDFEGESASLCSGTVVSSNVILTAAHCVLDETFSSIKEPAGFRVVTGNVDWASSPRTVSTVSRVAVDPNFAYATFPSYFPVRGDDALLQLSAPITQPPVRIATSQVWSTGTAATLVGWGEATSGGGPVETLRFGEAAVQSPEYCKSKSSHFEAPWSVCVLDYPSSRYSICHGDSGGPLLVFPAGEPLQIGVASYGVSETCSPTQPQYYTRADAIAPWVALKVGEWAPPPAPPVTSTPSPSTAPPAPATPAPTLPIMRRGQAVTFATRALQAGLGWRFGGRVDYRVTCTAASSPKQKCSVSWARGGRYYWGTVTVFYLLEGGKVVWGDHYRVQTVTGCHPRCSRQTFRG
ncbi:MAG: trypsin-like serine protease [Actinobacteria bacterium]|nr:trypsin-like serine protease [Actinomycetota bacterium]